MFFCYILLMKNQQFYIGQTSNLENRFKQHIEGIGSKTTKRYGVQKLLCYWICESRINALSLEKYLKTLTYAKKCDLINNPNKLLINYGIKLKGDYIFVRCVQKEM